jgi:hypothetical protein
MGAGDNLVYVDSRQVSGGAPSWRAIGTRTFPVDSATAPAWQLSAGNSVGKAWVTAAEDQFMYYTSAETP